MIVLAAGSGILEELGKWDRNLFIRINTEWKGWAGDYLFPLLRDPATWIPLYVVVLVYVVYKFKWKALPWILLAAATIGLSDQISSSLIKPYFGRIRPCNEPTLRGIMHTLLPYCGGNGSFTSSHAVNHFAIALFFYKGLRPYWGKWTALFFFWAAIICYAQVYVGAHYPGDVIAGAGLGLLIGACTAWVFKRYFNFGRPKVQQPLPPTAS